MENLAEILKAHKLTQEDYEHIKQILGREPNLVEIGIFSAMWSEHCSYKSSKKYLKGFPTEAPWVIQGPGENAGVIDIGDGMAAVLRWRAITILATSSPIKVPQRVSVGFCAMSLRWERVL